MTKTPRIDGSNEPNNRAQKKANEKVRPKRRTENGPLGFSSVMSDVTKGKKGGGEAGAMVDGALRHGVFQPMDAGTQAAKAMGKVETAEMIDAKATRGIESAQDALQSRDTSSNVQTRQGEHAHHHPQQQHLGRMPLRESMRAALSEALKAEIAEANKELHIELEPEHLGPLIIRLRKTGSRVTVDFRAQQREAASQLEAEAGLLRTALLNQGFETADVSVRHDTDLELMQPEGRAGS